MNRVWKKSLALLLCLVMCLALLPAAAFAENGEDEIFASYPPERYVPGGPENNEELFAGYAEKQMDSLRPEGDLVQAAHDSSASLTAVNRTIFTKLKTQIAAVAGGSVSSTVFEIPVSELGLSKTSWTASELGLDSLTVIGEDGTPTYSQEAMDAVEATVGISAPDIINALLADCPFELYWFDKTTGCDYHPYNCSGSETLIRISGNLIFTFAVASSYQNGDYKDVRYSDGEIKRYFCGVDADSISGVSAAVANAAAIRDRYAGLSAYDMLLGYKNEICTLVTYNTEAAEGIMDYGNPWQLIWVFDGDASTNVVCEGYAKAFQYLCDISDLSDDVMAWSVSGTMDGGTGAGAHMWNIVRMENGRNYLVDVTNCDEGSIGAPDALFLAGTAQGSVSDGYVFTINGEAVSYVYNREDCSIFSDDELSIAARPYLVDISTPDPGTVWTLEHLQAEIDSYLESGKTTVTIRFEGKDNFVVDEDVTLPKGMNFVVPKNSLVVEEGATMTVASGATISARNAEINGTLRVSGVFSMTSSASSLTVSGSLENKGSVVVLDPGFVRTENMTADGGLYYVDHYVSSEAAFETACAAAAADHDSAVVHEIYPQKMIALTTDHTVPANVRMRINSGTGISTTEGITLYNEGQIASKQSLQLLGTTVNDGVLTLMRVNAAFGSYNGSGTLRVYKEGDDPFVRLTGLEEEAFDCVLSQTNYWELTIRQVTVTWKLEDGTVLAEETVRYGTVPVYTGSTPEKEGSVFAGWSPKPAAVKADTVYTAVFAAADWSEAVYEFDYAALTVTATRSLVEDESYMESETVALTVKSLIMPSETADGEYVLESAEFENPAFEKQSVSIELPALGTLSVLRLPEQLTAIETEAFAGADCEAVLLPAGVTTIGSKAFANCAKLRYAFLPEGVEIAPDAFDGCADILLVYTR